MPDMTCVQMSRSSRKVCTACVPVRDSAPLLVPHHEMADHRCIRMAIYVKSARSAYRNWVSQFLNSIIGDDFRSASSAERNSGAVEWCTRVSFTVSSEVLYIHLGGLHLYYMGKEMWLSRFVSTSVPIKVINGCNGTFLLPKIASISHLRAQKCAMIALMCRKM